jgi:preprotein translocase subunit SecG
MYLLFIILIDIAAVLLSFIVTIQNSKGGGLASGFSSSNQIMGVRKTTDFLEKGTWGLIAFIVVISIATSYILPQGSSSNSSIIMEQAQQEERANPLNTPDFATPSVENIPTLPTDPNTSED